MNFIWYILVGIVIGLIIGITKKMKKGGLITYLIIGGAGGALGGALFDILINWGVWGNIIMAVAITVLVFGVINFFSKPIA